HCLKKQFNCCGSTWTCAIGKIEASTGRLTAARAVLPDAIEIVDGVWIALEIRAPLVVERGRPPPYGPAFLVMAVELTGRPTHAYPAAALRYFYGLQGLPGGVCWQLHSNAWHCESHRKACR